MKRNLFYAGVLFLILLALAAPALAGGWATITLDGWPAQITANDPVEIGFIVRQHGHDDRRLSGLDPTLTAKNAATGKTVIVHAKDEGAAGHYVAAITFPEQGAWSWSILAFGVDQLMPDLTVSAPLVKPPTSRQSPSAPAILAGLLGLAFLCVAAGLAWRKRQRWAPALVLAGLLIGGAGLASAAGLPAELAPAAGKPETSQPAAGEPATPVEYGKTLFIAKGCVTCHVNPKIEAVYRPLGIDVGKNLTNYVAAPEFLRLWLKDPKAVKPNTEMPNLELSQAEIEALIAFINSPADQKTP